MGFKSDLSKFSNRDISTIFSDEKSSLKITGTSCKFANCAALQRRSPATILYLPFFSLSETTTIGRNIPLFFID